MSEPVIFVKIEVPRCTLTHGTAPCTATQTGDAKCFNTFRTCSDRDNFDKGTQDLWFSRGMPAERAIVANALPFIRVVSTTPGTLNFAGMAPSEGGTGYVSTLTIQFANVPYSGFQVDPYRADRTYDARAQGTFWTNWLTRNPYHIGLKTTLYEGYAGQALEDMQQRVFYSTRATTNRATATWEAKDPTSYLDPQKTPVPKPSPGVLHMDVEPGQVDIPVKRATTADYPASGKIVIGDELIEYGGVVAAPWGIIIKASLRGAGGTEDEAHGIDDAVQEVFTVTGETIDGAIAAILAQSELPVGIFDATQAAAEVDYWRGPWRGHIARDVVEPTPAMDLVGEICRHSLVSMDYDEYAGQYKLRAVRGYDSTTPLLTDEADLIADSVEIAMHPDKRFSQVYMHHDLKTATSDPDEVKSYRSHTLVGGSGEGPNEYGIGTVRNIYLKWYTHTALIEATAHRVALLSEEIPRKIVFSLAPKNRGLRRGDVVRVRTGEDRDANGVPQISTWAITKVYEPSPGGVIECEGWDVSRLGRVGKILANDAADYDAGTADADGAYVLAPDGTLPDGAEGWRVQ